jgi:hypothetical protein
VILKQYGQAPTEARKDHPELDPLTDRNVPWYAWMLWPIVGIVALGLGMLLMRGCLGTVTP